MHVSQGVVVSPIHAPKETRSTSQETLTLRWFELCVDVGDYTTDHYEIDISQVSSDAELFRLIRERYKSAKRGFARQWLLKPRDVHFVLFSMSRRYQCTAGIHEKPDEFPPKVELDHQRYHYLHPKLRMPAKIFLHYLNRAKYKVWGEHSEDLWLQRLPKKLSETVLAEVVQSQNNSEQNIVDLNSDPDLAFGWGIHIIDGADHAVLAFIFGCAVALSLSISLLILGLAKTQEQAFGVGSYLVAMIACFTVAVYAWFQDL
ncbi:hypothetical protein EJ05DRAFT_483965 [Pseudovirgaria hyperparasitica]|uniref:Uncharacterized protein n=1 Tax=Pseudovirgaria hyperparasitica TaxID=470096 RepID=A0A6A6WC91_9PEZI|nr:uncharacterized protein EJ05DRAFT_483965 [Pseudovirgaria hyperparasitica]KAF2760195.1 hypothetical protein EJ05DRAFT_483965 [Pseudovirgaria hyperparasitica]